MLLMLGDRTEVLDLFTTQEGCQVAAEREGRKRNMKMACIERRVQP
jgi:hypothetical protein